MDLSIYIFLSAAYIMFTHMAMVQTREFYFFQTIGLFVIGGFVGAYLGSYLAGFVFALVMSMISWNHSAM